LVGIGLGWDRFKSSQANQPNQVQADDTEKRLSGEVVLKMTLAVRYVLPGERLPQVVERLLTRLR
jgi:hypothetical protein